MLQIGLFGAGHLGKIHLQQWAEIEGAAVKGIYEPDDAAANAALALYPNIVRYSDPTALIADIDAADIVSPTTTHYVIAKDCLLQRRHLFIEKPLAHTLEEAQELVKLVTESAVKCQVGHVERYNPAYTALGGAPLQPVFIEGHRLAQFNPRGTDVSVILDLMIHDIDIVLSLVKSPVKRISASGVAVVSESADIANARIEFDNGCVANLTASRISLKKMRKLRLFQRDAYIGIDFLEKKTEIVRLDDDSGQSVLQVPITTPDGKQRTISVQMPQIPETNAIRAELTDFTQAILQDRPTTVSVHDGYNAMDVAHSILKKMSLHNEQHNI